MRILLAAEGGSDEVVATRLIERHLGKNVTIQRKAMPGRGVDLIQRVASDCTRAAYFGHYDLVVHFDMDDTLPADFTDAAQSTRWNEIRSRMATTLASLPEAYRASELKMSLMTPGQATEAWLSWGREDESGRKWEHKSRHELKRMLFGNPPRGVVAKAEALAPELIAQMEANDDWPRTLRWFVDELTA